MELKGYTLIKELFVDNSGFGSENEPALTQTQFERELQALLEKYGQLTAKITNEGQFQVYIGLFTHTGKKIAEKIGNNTYKISYPDRTAIRLHDTDIVTFKGHKVILDNGGWETHTTKSRMNQYLQPYYSITQKNWEWFVNMPDNTQIPYKNGMELTI